VTATIFLVRHVPHAQQGRVLVGDTPVPLADGAEARFARLGERFRAERLDAVIASPLDRTQRTAAAIAAAAGLAVETDPDLREVEFGAWTGKSFAELEQDPAWRRWCADKALSRPPGGESMVEVKARMFRAVERARARWPDGRIALVSHGDPIKSAVCHYLGLALDFLLRFEVEPASLSVLAVGDWGAKLHRLNESVAP
jgi:probable phosphoglycerate mutase